MAASVYSSSAGPWAMPTYQRPGSSCTPRSISAARNASYCTSSAPSDSRYVAGAVASLREEEAAAGECTM